MQQTHAQENQKSQMDKGFGRNKREEYYSTGERGAKIEEVENR